MAEPFVLYEKTGAIATLTFNRPESRNAIRDRSDCDQIVAALEQLGGDPDVAVLILTGAGTAFNAGGDLTGMRDRNGIGPLASPAATRANYKGGVQRILKAFWEIEVPIVAAVNGPAIGLGCDLACICDIRVAADTAKFASSFVKLGIIPGDGGAWILPRAVGFSKAAEMIFTGELLSALEALACGLVSQVVPAADLLAEARALAERIAANPLQALRLAKRLLREGQHSRLSDVLELSAAFQALAHETVDHHEAIAAFFEKRPPKFVGR